MSRLSDDWDTYNRWRAGIERQLNQIGSQVLGNMAFQAERIADVVAQIEELREELRKLTERVDNAAKVFREHVKKNGE